MDLSIDNVYEILLHYHPLIYKNDLEWLEKGRIKHIGHPETILPLVIN